MPCPSCPELRSKGESAISRLHLASALPAVSSCRSRTDGRRRLLLACVVLMSLPGADRVGQTAVQFVAFQFLTRTFPISRRWWRW
jgi:hypothetical protein